MDPGFIPALIGFALTKGLDYMIEYLTKAVWCKSKCKALQSLLQELRDDVYNIEAKLQSRHTVAQDEDLAVKWWCKLRDAMKVAKEVVKECGVPYNVSRLNVLKRHELTERIDKVHQEIEKLADWRTNVAMHLDTHLKLQQMNSFNDYDAPGNAALRLLRSTREIAMCREEQTRLRDAQHDNRRHSTLSDFGLHVSAQVHNCFQSCFHPHQHHDSSFHEADQAQQFMYATNHENMNYMQMPQQSSTYVQCPGEYGYVTAQPAMEPQNQYLLNSWQ